MDTNVKIILTAQDKASQAIDQVGKKVGGLSKSITQNMDALKGMAVASGIAFAGLVAGASKAVKAYQEQERASARLEQIATQVTGATKEQIQGFKDLADAMQKVGVVDADALVFGQSQIASYTKSTSVVTTLSASLADLAVAQYGVNVSQDQAKGTADLLGKMLSGNLGAATRSGILVSAEYEKAFKSANTEQERAVIIAKIVADNYGGLNERMRQTSEGGVQGMKNAFGDLMEAIGKALVPSGKFIESVTAMINKVTEFVTKHPGIVKAFFAIGIAVTGLVFAFTALAVASAGLAIAMAPITIVIVGIAALIVSIGVLIYVLIQHWEDLKASFISAWEAIKGAFENAMNFLREKLGGLGEYFAWIFEFIFGNVQTKMEMIRQLVESSFSAVGEVFASIWETVIKPVVDAFKGALDAIADVLGRIIDFIGNGFKEAGKVFKIALDGAKSAVLSAWTGFQQFWQFLKDKFQVAIDKVKNTFKEIGDFIQNIIVKITELIQKFKAFAKELGMDVKGFFGKIFGGGGKNTNVNDAVISPTGDIVSTHPDDYLIATKKPKDLFGGGGGITININGGIYGNDAGVEVGNQIIKVLQLNQQL